MNERKTEALLHSIENLLRGIYTGMASRPEGEANEFLQAFVRVKTGLQVSLSPADIAYTQGSQQSSRNLGQTSCLLLRLDGYKLDAGWHKPDGSYVCARLYTHVLLNMCECICVCATQQTKDLPLKLFYTVAYNMWSHGNLYICVHDRKGSGLDVYF